MSDEVYECDEDAIDALRIAIAKTIRRHHKKLGMNAQEIAYATVEALVNCVEEKSEGWYDFIETVVGEVIAEDAIDSGVYSAVSLNESIQYSGALH